MNIAELQEQIGNNSFFVFNTDSDTAVVVSGLINDSGFSTVSFDNNGQATVVAINGQLARVVLGRDIFPEVECATVSLVGQTSHELTSIPTDIDGEFQEHQRGWRMCLFGKTKRFLDKHGNSAFRYLLEEDLEVNRDMDTHWREVIQQILNQS